MIPSKAWLKAHGLDEASYLAGDLRAPIRGGKGAGEQNMWQNYQNAITNASGNSNAFATGAAGQLNSIADFYAQAAQGQDPMIQAQRQAAVSQLNSEMARRGVFGSAAVNSLNALNQNYDAAALGQRNTDLQLQGGALDSASNFLQGILQNQTILPTLATAYKSAQNQGKGGGGKK